MAAFDVISSSHVHVTAANGLLILIHSPFHTFRRVLGSKAVQIDVPRRSQIRSPVSLIDK